MNNQEVKIELYRDGDPVPNNVTGNYTVESRITPNIPSLDLTNMLYAQLMHDRVNSGWATPLFSIFGREPYPIEWGAIMLIGDEKFKDFPVMRLWADTESIIGTADVAKEYVGSSTAIGTVNKRETKYDKADPFAYKFHVVFDFPTHACNAKAITEVLWHPFAFTNASDGMAYILKDRGVNPFVSDKQIIVGGMNENYCDFVKSPGGDIIVWNCYRSKVYCNIAGKVFEAYFEEPQLNTGTSSDHQIIGGWGNNAFHFMRRGYISTNPIAYRCKGIVWDETRGMHKIQTEAVMPPYVNLGGSSQHPEFFFEWEDHIFIGVLQGDGYNGGNGEPLRLYKFNKELTNLVSSNTLNNYANDYGVKTSIMPILYHEETENKMYILGPGRATFKMNTSLETEVITSYASSNPIKNYGGSKFKKVPGIKPYGSMSMTGPLSSSNPGNPYCFGDCELFGDYYLRFKLSKPIVKKADETLKLTFDITIKNGNVYES